MDRPHGAGPEVVGRWHVQLIIRGKRLLFPRSELGFECVPAVVRRVEFRLNPMTKNVHDRFSSEACEKQGQKIKSDYASKIKTKSKDYHVLESAMGAA